jgi:hypothetical protein
VSEFIALIGEKMRYEYAGSPRTPGVQPAQ